MNNVADELIKIAKLINGSKIDGMDKRKAVNVINREIGPLTKGLFKDNHWRPIKDIWEVLDGMDLDWNLTSNRYRKEDGVPVGKEWMFEVFFINKKGKKQKLYGTVVASGAGSLKDPLDRYDVVAYVS